eukprot:m.83461 g.83461  ORF g.83461 m.83461 type:complete len:291 (-) comp11209_c0_seq2:155-1027(-)
MALREVQQPAMDTNATSSDCGALEVTGRAISPDAPVDDGGEQNLQDAFKAFLKRKKMNYKRCQAVAKQDAENAAPQERTPEYKEALRKKFVERALGYQGVPYHPRYHTDPASPHHKAPLYLDCCGLVRRVARDLEKDFGFVIGRYNQSYQFDTLPIRISKEEMKPGDLVFLEAPYYDAQKKPQTHNMQHVEIWLGDGDKTLGARWSKGVVEIHDSYDFVSKKYGPNKYYFCSIETWLDGVCKSHRRGFPWPHNPKKLAKGSIFLAESDGEQADQEEADEECSPEQPASAE